MSLIGHHVVPVGSRDGYADHLRALKAAAARLALVKTVEDSAPGREARDILKGLLGIHCHRYDKDPRPGIDTDLQAVDRFEEDGETYRDPATVAVWYYDIVRDFWAKDGADLYECFNEFAPPDPLDYAWIGDFYIAMFELIDSDSGVDAKIATMGCSSGNPPTIAHMRALIPMCQAAKAKGHYLSLHEYGGVGGDIQTLRGTEPYHALRYRWFYSDVLRPNNANCKLIITEAAQAGGFNFIGTEALVEDFRWYDLELWEDPEVDGVAIFTLGRFYNANYQAALPALTEYIINTPTDRPPTEPAPTPPEIREYEATIGLLHPSQWAGAWRAPLAKRWGNITRSADDAGSRPGNDASISLTHLRVIAVNPQLWKTDPDAQTLAQFMATHFQIDQYDEVSADSPTLLEAALAELEGETEPSPPDPPDQPAPAPKKIGMGLHLSAAAGGATDSDMIALQVARLDWAKITTNTPPDGFDRIVAAGIRPDRILLRLFVDWPNQKVPVEVVYSWFGAIGQPDTHPLSWFFKRGGRLVEVTNEPNLKAEGLGTQWLDARGFGEWFKQFIEMGKRDYPDLLFGLPGLSPQDNAPAFFDEYMRVIDYADWVGAHAYAGAGEPWALTAPGHGGYWRNYADMGRPIYITEMSVNVGNVSLEDKAAQYIAYPATLEAPVKAVFYYVGASQSEADYKRAEPWIMRDGSLTVIPHLVGSRPVDPDQTSQNMALVWFTDERRVTQDFGVNPEYYKDFGLPAHEGIDGACKNGGNVYAPASGKVTSIGWRRAGHPYGYAIRIECIRKDGTFEVVLAHLEEGSARVAVGQMVEAGQLVGLGDSTGNVDGSHTHITLKKEGAQNGGYGNIVDPTPYFLDLP